jgi:diguanylate cyclase (GGDEF)-like protein
MIDMDHFGTLNKKYGEAFGDKVILSAAKVFRESFREDDILSRFGGDEFSFLLPNTNGETARKLCEAMMEKLRSVKFPEHPELVITLSIGIACTPLHGDNPETLKEAADKALYEAKEAGRDRALLKSAG